MAGWFGDFISKAKSIAGKVVGAVSSVVNNPIVAQVAGMACPGVYNAVKMGVGMASKGLGAIGLTTTGAAAPVATAASISKATVSVTVPLKPTVTTAPAVSTVSTPDKVSGLVRFRENTGRIVAAFKKG